MLLLSASLSLVLQQATVPPVPTELAQAKVCSALSDAYIRAFETAVAAPDATDVTRANLEVALDTKRLAEMEAGRLSALATPDERALAETQFERSVERINRGEGSALQDQFQECVLSLSGW